MTDVLRPYVELWLPTYRDQCWGKQRAWIAREATLSRHLVGVSDVCHRPTGQARQEICTTAFAANTAIDLVLMMDDDIVVDSTQPGRSVIDQVVKQWSRAERDRILYAPTLWQSALQRTIVVNDELAPDGTTLRGGSAFMLVPRGVWERAVTAGIEWAARNEDYAFCDAVRGLGMRVEPILDIRVRHMTEWRPPLECIVGSEGKVHPVGREVESVIGRRNADGGVDPL